ncbi:hypothetical protein H0H93_007505 [Arthromyces matolae]|nr:hypothetical protein H0H93_007505 [Arthromyces matolae]
MVAIEEEKMNSNDRDRNEVAKKKRAAAREECGCANIEVIVIRSSLASTSLAASEVCKKYNFLLHSHQARIRLPKDGTHVGSASTNIAPEALVELAMSNLSAEIRRIPNWRTLRLDPDTRMDWAQMAHDRVWHILTPSSTVPVKLAENQIEYVLDELAGYAALYDHDNNCQVSCFERIWEGSLSPTNSLHQSFQCTLSHLRQATSASPWDASALCTSLVDPHSYPLIYDRTLTRFSSSPRAPSRLRTLPSPSAQDIYTLSTSFAFLPTPVYISPNGDAKFTSYINNLHPTAHSTLYDNLTSLLTLFLPLFEHVLTDLHRNNPLPSRILPTKGPRYRVWEEPEEPLHSDDEEGWVQYERELRHWVMHRPIELPDVSDGGYLGALESRRHKVSLRGKELKVVVGIEDIRLEPGGPAYMGSPWHVEGMRNERIVACGEYYAEIVGLL